jgi:class 3 adenylate cyclase
MRLSPVVAQLLVWLQKRHQEHEVFGRIVSYVEDTLAEQGNAERRDEAQAIAFVDLSGYTELTVEAGDERAAQFATSLQALQSLGAFRPAGATGALHQLIGRCRPSAGGLDMSHIVTI